MFRAKIRTRADRLAAGMRERTITVILSPNHGTSRAGVGVLLRKGRAIAPINNAANVIYVCPATPLQSALSKVLMADENYYGELRDKFDAKRRRFSEGIRGLGFDIYNSGSAFYLWARIPEEFSGALPFNEMLMEKAGVGMTPGAAFADTDKWDPYVRICIAREDAILDGAMEKLRGL